MRRRRTTPNESEASRRVGISGARLSPCPDGRDERARTGVFRVGRGLMGEENPHKRELRGARGAVGRATARDKPPRLHIFPGTTRRCVDDGFTPSRPLRSMPLK